MNIHKNARLTPHGRERAGAAGAERADAEGRRRGRQASARGRCANGWRASQPRAWPGLHDRTSRPHRLHRPTPAGGRRAGRSPAPPALDRQADRRRGRRLAGHRQPHPPAAGAQPDARPEPAEPVRRYEREQPGELIHIDIKKLGRFDAIGHRITGDRTGQSNAPRHRLGVRPRLHRRRLPHRLRRRSCPTRRRRAPSPSSRPPSPTTQASASPSPAS